jgi:hypothetical protein
MIPRGILPQILFAYKLRSSSEKKTALGNIAKQKRFFKGT